MGNSSFNRVAGLVFAVVALAHAWRAVQAIPVLLGSTAVPVWISWVAVAGAGTLSIWGFRSRG